ncbi:hypothetical protein [Afipia sp. 1NLS2]|uniref:hypothetical protein n=1 Tax=Afipia sp. 1NLS2 TaxID=666684 RepID=UPI0001DA0805|nr:hypothetical protein [Afipia sp. 1NLS2]EFI50530.1 conserved hypothetical protein [Afipia sp. 1NLS2]
MRKKISFVVLVAANIAAAPTLATEQCPINDAAIAQAGGYANAVEAAVKAAPDCERAYKTLEICQLGSSGDNALSDIVRDKCEPLFLGKESRGVKAAYKKKLTGCERIAKQNEGTMYLGLAAVCQARAARDFARKYAKAH